jgi:hypothetical protein
VQLALTLGQISGSPALLERLDVADPRVALGRVRVAGLAPAEELLGIDYRPATNTLYGVSSLRRLYTIDPATGVARAVGTGPLPQPLVGPLGVDFDPATDRLRVVSAGSSPLAMPPVAGQNLRIDPDTLEVVAGGSPVYAPGDPNAGARPRIVAAAYAPALAGAAAAPLFVIDAERDVLARMDPPDSGRLTTVGPLGVAVNPDIPANAFDIAPDGAAFAALAPPPPVRFISRLYAIDLTTGAARLVGDLTVEPFPSSMLQARGLALVPAGVTIPEAPSGLPALPRTGGGSAVAPAAVAAAVSLVGVGLLARAARRRRPA